MDILQFLIDKGADIHAVDYQNEDALYISFTQMLGKKLGRFPKYYKEVAKFLIDKGADINRRYKKEETLLMIITRLDNDVDNIIFLLDNGANPNLKNSTGETALDIAKKAPKKKESIIKYLQNVTNMEI
jgi:ankyrin repeat protein